MSVYRPVDEAVSSFVKEKEEEYELNRYKPEKHGASDLVFSYDPDRFCKIYGPGFQYGYLNCDRFSSEIHKFLIEKEFPVDRISFVIFNERTKVLDIKFCNGDRYTTTHFGNKFTESIKRIIAQLVN